MSDRQLLAEHGTGLCVAGLAALGVTAPPLIPIAILAAWGIDRFKSCKSRRQRATIDNVLKQIEAANPDHRAVGPALALLKENRHKVAITAAHLADAEPRGNFPDALYDIVFKGVEVPTDDGVEALLRMILTAAWQDLRLEDDYNKLFLQESVTAIEADIATGFSRVEAILDAIKADTSAIRETISRAETKIDNMEVAINSVATANRDLLEALAGRFRIANAFDMPDATLRSELEKRAEDYRRVLKEVADLKGISARIDNVHGAAMDAVRNLRLAEARTLLRDAREILRQERLRPILDDNAKLMEAEAEVELLDHNVEAAFQILSAAADSFASIDSLEPARRRILTYFEILRNHGLRYGGAGLPLSQRFLVPS